MIDGENIKEYNLFSLRKQLSIATQNVYIKDDSIENNILMGRKKEDCAYDEICKLVGMESILSKFPKEKDVSVGEKWKQAFRRTKTENSNGTCTSTC